MKLIFSILFCLFFQNYDAIFRCPTDSIDEYYPDPDNCESFYRCYEGRQAKFQCGPGTWFNSNTSNCDWPNKAICRVFKENIIAAESSHLNEIKKPFLDEKDKQIKNNYFENHKVETFLSPKFENFYDHITPSKNKTKLNPIYSSHVSRFNSQSDKKQIFQLTNVANLSKTNNFQNSYNNHLFSKFKTDSKFSKVPVNHSMISNSNNSQKFNHEIIFKNQNQKIHFKLKSHNGNQSIKKNKPQIKLPKSNKLYNSSYHKTNEDSVSNHGQVNTQIKNSSNNVYKPNYHYSNRHSYRRFNKTSGFTKTRFFDKSYKQKNLQINGRRNSKNVRSYNNRKVDANKIDLKTSLISHQTKYQQTSTKQTLKNNKSILAIETPINLNKQSERKQKQPNSKSILFNNQVYSNIGALNNLKTLHKRHRSNHQLQKNKLPLNSDLANSASTIDFKLTQTLSKLHHQHLNKKPTSTDDQIFLDSVTSTISLFSESHNKPNYSAQHKQLVSNYRQTLNESTNQFEIKQPKAQEILNKTEKHLKLNTTNSSDKWKSESNFNQLFDSNSSQPFTPKVSDIVNKIHSNNLNPDSNFKPTNGVIWHRLSTDSKKNLINQSNNKVLNVRAKHPRLHWAVYSTLNSFHTENETENLNQLHHHIHSSIYKENLNDFERFDINKKSRFDARFPRAADTLHTIEHIFKNDPYAIPDLVKHLRCDEINFKFCSDCENLNWLKFSKILLNSKPNITITSKSKHVLQNCFNLCSKTNCVAFSFNTESGACFFFPGPVHVKDVSFNESFVTIIKEPINGLIIDEWFYSDSSIPTGQEIAAYPSETKLTCLRTCITIGENCKVIAFDYKNKICKAFDKINGKRLALQSSHITLQHRSIHEHNDAWRFTKLGANRLNSSQALNTISIRDDQECFNECLNTHDCLFVSIGGELFKECQIFNEYLPLISDFNYQSYFLKLPRDSFPFVEVRDRYFYGHPIAKFKHFDLKNCLEAAKSIKEAVKVSFFKKERPECQIFGDAAQVGNKTDLVLEVQSFKSTLPLDWEYMAFTKAIGVTLKEFNFSKITKYKIEGASALPCLKLCLEENCEFVNAHYLENEKKIECDLLNENKDYSFVANKSVDLFVRKFYKHDIPKKNIENEENHCSSKLHLLLADENLVNFENVFHHDRLKKANIEHYIAPHDFDFVGMPEISLSRHLNRHKRSLYALLLQNGNLFDQLTKINSDKIKKKVTIQKSNDLIKDESLEKSNDQLLHHFIDQIMSYDEEIVSSEEVIANMITAIRKVRQNKNKTTFEMKFCQIKYGSVSRPSTCLEENVCKESPAILYADDEQFKSDCENIRINSSCRVICRSGYRSNEPKVTCEQIGRQAVWNTRRVECVPDDQICADLPWIVFKSDTGLEKNKINYIVKYNKNRHLPLFSIYYQGVENSWIVGAEQNANTVSLPCSQLKGFQMSHLSYKNSNYTKGYLASPLAFRYSQAAIDSVNFFVNVAPQDPFTNFGPWLVLDTKLQAYLKDNPGFVISGICPQQQKNLTIPVPKCFWKIVCTKSETGNVTAAAFYHENSIPISANAKRARVEEVMNYTNPNFISSIIGSEDYNSIWSKITESYSELKKIKNESQLLTECQKAEKLEPEHFKFWNNILTDQKKGLPWPKNFQDGMMSSNVEYKNSKFSRRSIKTSFNSNKCKLKVIGYVGLDYTNFKTSNYSHRLLSHLVLLSSIKINYNGSLSLAQDNKNVYNRIYELKLLKKKNPNLKLLFSLGGWSNSEHFSKIAENKEFQKNFIRDIIAFIDYWNIDGIDILWQYPVIGGKIPGKELDKPNFVKLLFNIKSSLVEHKEKMNRKNSYLLVVTGPGIDWIIDHGYDLKKIINIVDWINIMAFDFFGPWNSTWGSYTGPHAPLYFGAPDRFPGKLNVESALKKYACETEQVNKLVLGLSFFGRYWKNVGESLDSNKQGLFRKSVDSKGTRGGLIPYSTISTKLRSNFPKFKIISSFDNKTMTPYIWLNNSKTLISYENEVSLKEKINYVIDYDLGGIMLWSLDMDDDELNLLNTVEASLQCSSFFKPKSFKCNPIKQIRYWTQYDGDGSKDRMCGKRAPLINNFYPICDPDNPGYGCCSASGWCGSGPEFCDCLDCIDFKVSPEKILTESIRPSIPIRWHTLDFKNYQTQPICGLNAPLLPNGEIPICNPDDSKGYCCSAAGFCGVGPDYCSCKGCINFQVNVNYRYPNRTWFTMTDELEKVEKCEPKAPKIKNQYS